MRVCSQTIRRFAVDSESPHPQRDQHNHSWPVIPVISIAGYHSRVAIFQLGILSPSAFRTPLTSSFHNDFIGPMALSWDSRYATPSIGNFLLWPNTSRIASKVVPDMGRFGGRGAEPYGDCRRFSGANLPLGPYGPVPHIVELSPIERNRN